MHNQEPALRPSGGRVSIRGVALSPGTSTQVLRALCLKAKHRMKDTWLEMGIETVYLKRENTSEEGLVSRGKSWGKKVLGHKP